MYTVKVPLTKDHTGLIIGCGENFAHKKLHPSQYFYTVDPNQEVAPHLVGSIENEAVIGYLKQQHFQLICIECVPALTSISSPSKAVQLIKNLFDLLSEEGTLMILCAGNLNPENDTEVYKALLSDCDSLQLFSIFRKEGMLFSVYPNNTIIASRAGIDCLSAPIQNYIDNALSHKLAKINPNTIKVTQSIVKYTGDGDNIVSIPCTKEPEEPQGKPAPTSEEQFSFSNN